MDANTGYSAHNGHTGVIWWDKKGQKHKSALAPSTPIAPAIVLFAVGIILSFPAIVFIIKTCRESDKRVVHLLTGVGLLFLALLVFLLAARCYMKKKNETIAILYTGTYDVTITGADEAYTCQDHPSIEYLTG